MIARAPTRETPATCANAHCAAPYQMVESFILDTWTFGCALCPKCERAEIEENAKRQRALIRHSRLIQWAGKDMPFNDTDVSRLPAAESATVLSWKWRAGGLIISGDTGMGKTRTVVELLRRLWIEEGRDFAYISWTRWKQQLDRAHRYGGNGVEQYVKPFYKQSVACFDDLGHGAMNENTLGCLFELLSHRASHGLPTIITTQHSGETLKAKMHKVSAQTCDAICRRMKESFEHVQFKDRQLLSMTSVTPSNGQ